VVELFGRRFAERKLCDAETLVFTVIPLTIYEIASNSKWRLIVSIQPCDRRTTEKRDNYERMPSNRFSMRDAAYL